MPEDNQNNNNQNNTNDQNNTNNQNNATGGGATSKQVILGCDSNGVDDAGCQATVKSVLEGGGYQVEALSIGPNAFASYSYSENAKGKNGVFLIAASLVAYLDAAKANFDFNVMGIRGDVTPWGTEEGFKSKGVPKDHHGDCILPECDTYQGKTYPELNQIHQGKVQAVPGETPQKLGENILAALNGGGVGSTGGGNSGGGAQIKDKTFERCLRRVCAATDSIFIVESNAAVLFPYVDWMAFTLRQKINTIKSDEIDPNIFSMEYGNDGFYNKVTIAWGGATLPERFPKNEDGTPKDVERVTNYTAEDILKNMQLTNFNYDTFQEQQDLIRKQKEEKKKAKEEKKKNKTNSLKEQTEDIVTNKGDTTQTISVDDKGVTLLSEQYDALVEKYGEQEKRLESEAPDYETAQYIVNALLIQYIRDYNNMCKCRALSNRKYIGGTFYSVENPFTKESELFYLNGYTLRIQKHEPMYHDLDFRYGPEGAEEILDYQTLSGGAASGGGTTSAGSTDEAAIWERAKKACHQTSCPELRVSESDTQDPQVAEDYFNKMEKSGQKFCLTCYGMSSWLYFQFNYKTNIKCQVIGTSDHHVVMLDRGDGKGMVETREEYRQLEWGYRWDGQGTNVLLPAPGGNTSQSGGNTNRTNTNGGNRGGN